MYYKEAICVRIPVVLILYWKCFCVQMGIPCINIKFPTVKDKRYEASHKTELKMLFLDIFCLLSSSLKVVFFVVTKWMKQCKTSFPSIVLQLKLHFVWETMNSFTSS